MKTLNPKWNSLGLHPLIKKCFGNSNSPEEERTQLFSSWRRALLLFNKPLNLPLPEFLRFIFASSFFWTK